MKRTPLQRGTPLASRVTIEPGKMGGEPCIRGTRIPAASLASLATRGATVAEILSLYPCLTAADVKAALRWVARKKSTPLARTSMKRRPRRARPDKDDRPYLEHFIRRLPCCAPGCTAPAPSDAHHQTGAGMGMRAHDHETLPLCRRCHDALDAFRGAFAGWTREERAAWQASMARVLRAAYELPRLGQHSDNGAPTF